MRKIFQTIKGWPLGLKLIWINNFLLISNIVLGKIYHFESIYISLFLTVIQLTIFFLVIRKIKKQRRENNQRLQELKKKIEELLDEKKKLDKIGKEIEQLKWRIENLKQFKNQN